MFCEHLAGVANCGNMSRNLIEYTNAHFSPRLSVLVARHLSA
jgi:hypothetical protein